MSLNSTELLDQFILESRECLERVGQRLLDVEKAPQDPDLLNDLFRQVHTLKGNCGLFEFKALELVVHAGEDVLDRIRNGRLSYNESIADALLEAMDYTASLIDVIEAEGTLPEGTQDRARLLAAALRDQIGEPVVAPVAGRSEAALAAPDWSNPLPAEWRQPGRVLVRYVPEETCFFKGEDPWHLARTAPGLLHLDVRPNAPWPEGDQFDCYACNLDIRLVSEAPLAEVEAHFRYVPEQVDYWRVLAPPVAVAVPTPAPHVDLLNTRLQQVWDDQRRLLGRTGVSAGTVAAVRQTLANLLACRDDHALVSQARTALQGLAPGPVPLAQWAQQYHPDGHGHAHPPGHPQAMPQPPRRNATHPTAEEGGAERGQKVLKVSQDKIDRLMELIGEMVVAKNALPYLATRAESLFGQRELAREIKTQYSVINRIAEDMQHAIMQVRMLPVGIIFQRFGRLVRDLSKKLGKDVSLVIEGEDTEADKNVIESLADPLIHILRNSLDHGLETPEVRLAAGKPAQGTLRVAARQEGDRVMLTISDDGTGIDTDRVRLKAVERGLIPSDRASSLTETEAVQLVFLPGFSTSDAISDLSGRGVGMDVVRNAVERINGQVELDSVRGQGTTVRLTLPLSMAVTNVMMIEAGERRFGVPMDLIVETVRVPAEDIHHFKRSQTTVLRGRIVPLRALNELLGLDCAPRPNEDGELAVLVVRLGSENVGLLVDNFHGTSDIILKPLEGVLTGITGFAGTALMGDGSVLMILNPKELV
ncbi:chemotaxis protein CheA [Sphaerotilus montanus]|uniref:Chemotaxis protein CheA n=1 Tax=Sphaerotilus montanus TaxID=522889 RepID=A0A7Y9QZU0_9BURK|nr:chemotaxis protein CheA [Sphaerotilus montanus]NYG32979.1 two-component system chemotaxis sensor kinase CheA [Sphaerotilus montanus]NZD56241.1 chemotaxis protein CheA [Sphaerotilus montanus]